LAAVSEANGNGIHLDCGYRIDVLVEDTLIVERPLMPGVGPGN